MALKKQKELEAKIERLENKVEEHSTYFNTIAITLLIAGIALLIFGIVKLVIFLADEIPKYVNSLTLKDIGFWEGFFSVFILIFIYKICRNYFRSFD
jgi:hypothetical protein